MFKHRLSQESVHLFFRVGCDEIDKAMELIYGVCWHLNLAITRFATPQRPDVRTLEREVLQVGWLTRTAEFADGEVARKFPKPFEVS